MGRRTRGWLVVAAAVALVLLVLLLRDRDQRSRSTHDARAAPVSVTAGDPESSGGASARDRPATRAAGDITFQIRSLADGQPVPGLLIHGRGETGVVSAEAGETGMVSLPVEAAAELSVDSPRWSAGPAWMNQPEKTGVFWVHGWIEVDGVVSVRGDATGFSPEDVALHLLVDGEGAPKSVPGIEALARLVRPARLLGQPSAEGRFNVRIPRVYGVTVAATCEGWKSARQTIDVSRGVETERVELWLERVLRIRGILRSSDGTPFDKLPVSCLSLDALRSTGSSLENRLRLLQPDGGIAGSVNGVTGEARVKFISLATTDENGRFELSVPIQGEVLVVAFPFGHRPVYVDLGILGSDDADNLDIVAERVRDSPMVRIVANGKPVEGNKVFISDLSLKDGDAQPGVNVRRDADGRIRADWLIPGHRFYFHIGRYNGHLVWDGRDTLDVAKDLEPVSELPSR